MAQEKKFLDAEGLKYFWGMCRLQNDENFQTNLEIFNIMAAALSRKIDSVDGKGGVSEYFTTEEKEKLTKIISIGDEGITIAPEQEKDQPIKIITKQYVDASIEQLSKQIADNYKNTVVDAEYTDNTKTITITLGGEDKKNIVLPTGDSEKFGLVKLYSQTGNSVDGTINQKDLTDLLKEKVSVSFSQDTNSLIFK